MKYRSVVLSKWIFFAFYWLLILFQILFISNFIFDSGSDRIIPFVMGGTVAWDVISGNIIFVLIIQFVFLYFFALQILRQAGMVEIYPQIDRTKSLSLSIAFPIDRLKKWTIDIAKQEDITVDKIFLAPINIPNAFTFSLPGIGSVLVLHTNMLEIASEQEVQSVIAHELGHIKKHDSLIKLFASSPSQYLHIVYTYIYILLVLGVANALFLTSDLELVFFRAMLLGFVYILITTMKNITASILQKSFRDAEMLCDHYAAEVVGPEITINMLIKLGTRVDLIKEFYEEFLSLIKRKYPGRSSLSPDEFMKLLNMIPSKLNTQDVEMKALIPWIYVYSQLKELQQRFYVDLSEREIIHLAQRSATKLYEERQRSETKFIPAKKQVPQLLDWRIADEDQSGDLNREEIHNLVQYLKNNPKRMLFREETELSLFLDHPNIRQRILFIYDNFF